MIQPCKYISLSIYVKLIGFVTFSSRWEPLSTLEQVPGTMGNGLPWMEREHLYHNSKEQFRSTIKLGKPYTISKI